MPRFRVKEGVGIEEHTVIVSGYGTSLGSEKCSKSACVEGCTVLKTVELCALSEKSIWYLNCMTVKLFFKNILIMEINR